MSTTTVYVSPMRSASRAELRAQQRAAREAARRIEAMAEQEARYTNLVERRDALTGELPDLVFTPGPFPHGSAEDAARRWVDQQEAALDAAASAARDAKIERVRRAAAWQAFHEARDAAMGEVAVCRALAADTGATFQPPSIPQPPTADADARLVSTAVEAYATLLAELRRHRSRFETLAQTRAGVRAQAGTAVHAVSAIDRVDQACRQRDKDHGARTSRRIAAALSRHCLERRDLPAGLNALIDVIVAHGLDPLPATDWIGRHRSRLIVQVRARGLAASPPEVLDDPALGRRWTALSSRLEAVANGAVPWDSALELAWKQLHDDSRTAAGQAFLRAQFLAEAQKHGFAISDADEDGLTVMDLTGFDGYWVELREQVLADGSIASISELRAAEGGDPAADARATAAACQAMRRLGGDEKAPRLVEEIERTARVRRSHRPAKRTLAARMS